MLNDRERETLADIERALTVEDPALVRRFEAARSPSVTRGDRALALATGLCLLLSALAVLVGDLGAAAGVGTLAASLAVIRRWLRLSRAPAGGAGRPPAV
jgi:hypothetical protein